MLTWCSCKAKFKKNTFELDKIKEDVFVMERNNEVWLNVKI